MGHASVSMDDKGRLAIPKKHRGPLQAACGGTVVVTADTTGALLVFPYPEWCDFADRLMQLPNSGANAVVRDLQRLYWGYAETLTLDGQGRFATTTQQRALAGLEKSCVIVGIGRKLEVWSEARWQARLRLPELDEARTMHLAQLNDFVI
ncbi:MAG: division/cell wall cluster transcriptional repressor MraZ [Pseudomonadota bacterium]|nr:division/cell wall cluster transcriptional repressor MraZ [Pseudomonadota bacterium]HJO34621.1 division/cell wall cluster transcriptional repressor MraZ [Gammaproteobacteria bacterium]